MKFLVIGDSCIDIFIYGEIERIAPEAPVPIIRPIDKVENDGMAKNVRNNVRALGDDIERVDIITNLNDIKKIRYVDARYNHMVLRVDENDKCVRIDLDEIDIQEIEDEYDALIISDYNKGFLTEEDIEYISTVNIPVFLDTKKYLGDWCKNVDFIKINIQEHKKNFETIPKYPMLESKLIITQGGDGCLYKNKLYPAEKVSVRDVSGEGDTFISGFAYGYIKSNEIEHAINFAQECTKIVVQKSGVATV